MPTIGEKLRELRKRKGWTQQTLADDANFPGPWTVSRLETQGTDSLQTLGVVCKVLGVEVWELLRDVEEEKSGAEGNNQFCVKERKSCVWMLIYK